LSEACRVVGISPRTVQRWRKQPDDDDRRHGPHQRPHNALTLAEEALIVSVITSARYAGLSPRQLVPQLADEGLYLASESTMYRVQRRYGLRPKRRLINRRDVTRACAVHRAKRPNQVWSWDITLLPTVVRGAYLHLCLIVDVWSRRIMGWRVAETESAAIAAVLMRQTCHNDNIDPEGLVLHSDNGAAMRGNTMLATLRQLGVVPSFSRPHVSNDNPY
jgi:putative transposase